MHQVPQFFSLAPSALVNILKYSIDGRLRQNITLCERARSTHFQFSTVLRVCSIAVPRNERAWGDDSPCEAGEGLEMLKSGAVGIKVCQ